MGDPGLLEDISDISGPLPEAGANAVQRAAAGRPLTGAGFWAYVV